MTDESAGERGPHGIFSIYFCSTSCDYLEADHRLGPATREIDHLSSDERGSPRGQEADQLAYFFRSASGWLYILQQY